MAEVHRYRVTPPAKADLIDIAEYTRERWGLTQQEVYLSGLFAFLEDIAIHPSMGRIRLEKYPEVLSRLYQKRHVVFYQRADAYVDILRILHVKRDAESTFRY